MKGRILMLHSPYSIFLSNPETRISAYFKSLSKMLFFNESLNWPRWQGNSLQGRIPFGTLAHEYQVPGRLAVTVITKYLQAHLEVVLPPDRRYLTPSRKDGTCRVHDHSNE